MVDPSAEFAFAAVLDLGFPVAMIRPPPVELVRGSGDTVETGVDDAVATLGQSSTRLTRDKHKRTRHDANVVCYGLIRS